MRVQLHKFIDLTAARTGAKQASEPRTRPDTVDRRSFLSVAAALAGLTGMASTAFARNFGADAEPQRYPEPDVVVLDKRFKYKLGNTPIQRLHRGTLWAEGPAWSTVGPLSAVERHSQQRAVALAGGRWARFPQIPLSSQQQQWKYLRLPGPADCLRASHASRGAVRAQWQRYRPG